MLSILSWIVPRGISISTTSPTFLFNRPCAMGVLMDIFPCLRLASVSLTIVYFIFDLSLRLVISTVDMICTASLLRRDVSTIFACAIVIFISLIFASRCRCASLAASYSEFSLRSPLSTASAIAADALGRSTDSKCCN